MKRSIGCLRLVSVVTLAMAAPAMIHAQNLKCFILTPPEQLLEGVKQVAITDLSVTTSFQADDPPGREKKGITGLFEKLSEAGKAPQRFADSGTKLTDMMIALLLQDKRGIEAVGSGFLGLSSKEGKSFQSGARTNVFSVVERSRMQQVMNELQLGQSGAINEAQAAQVGQLLGVD